jgi:hypothetical protein
MAHSPDDAVDFAGRTSLSFWIPQTVAALERELARRAGANGVTALLLR